MANHESFSADSGDDSLKVWQEELSEAQDKPTEKDSLQLWRQELNDAEGDIPKDSVKLWQEALKDNESGLEKSPAQMRAEDLNDLERAEKRMSLPRKIGDKLLHMITKREITSDAERGEAKKEVLSKISSATLKVAEKLVATAAAAAAKTAMSSMGL